MLALLRNGPISSYCPRSPPWGGRQKAWDRAGRCHRARGQRVDALDRVDDGPVLGQQGIERSPVDVRVLRHEDQARTDAPRFADRHQLLDACTFADVEQAITAVRSIQLNGTPPPGLPRRRGSPCCRAEAKNLSKSMCNRSILSGFPIGGLYENAGERDQPVRDGT
ncbi:MULTISPECIES: hypothetical protein [unclassified Shinella]|uniref:hypothetical protein n=1 Tax=unclassified Shinella TaxID=2643062 RepID=UPI00234FA8B0|nr:hypothetical protein [Shinella sp. YE25]MDC7259787.1 hypothetical protein [Shinella sp. YE25]